MHIEIFLRNKHVYTYKCKHIIIVTITIIIITILLHSFSPAQFFKHFRSPSPFHYFFPSLIYELSLVVSFSPVILYL